MADEKFKKMLEEHLVPFKDEEQELAYVDAVYSRRKLLSREMAELVYSKRKELYENKGDKEGGFRALDYYLLAENPEKAFEAWKSQWEDEGLDKVLNLFEENQREKMKRKAHLHRAKRSESNGAWEAAAKYYDLAGDSASHAACILQFVRKKDTYSSHYIGTENSRRAARYFLAQDENDAAGKILCHAWGYENSAINKAEFGYLLVEKNLLSYSDRGYYLPKFLRDCKAALKEAVEKKKVSMIKKLNNAIQRLEKEVKNEISRY
jgi:hypothetical protein